MGLGRAESESSEADPFDRARTVILSHLEEAVTEIQAPFAYALQQYPGTHVDGLLLVGQGASMPHLAGVLADLLEVQTRVVALADLAPGAAASTGTGSGLTAAAGLAQFGI